MSREDRAVVRCPFYKLIFRLKVPDNAGQGRVKTSFFRCQDCKTPLVAVFPQGTAENCGVMSLDRETMEKGDLIARLCHATDKVQSFLAQMEDWQDGPDLSDDDFLSIYRGVDHNPDDDKDEAEGPRTVEEFHDEVTALVDTVKSAITLGIMPKISDHELAVFAAMLDSGLDPEDL